MLFSTSYKENNMENLHRAAQRSRPERKHLAVGFARSASDILDAQRLRHRISAGEMGANLPSRTPGVDHEIGRAHV